MIHHYSIAVNDTARVAGVLASLFGGVVSRFGPYPNSWIVWMGDQQGTAIELYPRGTEMVPDRSGGQAQFIHNDTTSGYCATHAAISIARSRQEIIQLAEEQGWQARELPRGGFSVIEFWIENQVMIELLTPDMAADYLAVTAKYCRDVNMDKLK